MEAHAIPGPRTPARRSPLRHAVLSDEHLARLVGTGDERAFVTLYERYHQHLYRYCRSMLRHQADAQDAMQSTLAGAYAALTRSRRDAPVRPWLFRIAHNEAISLLRRRRPEAELSEDIAGVASSVEEQRAARERLALLVTDLLELPWRQRGSLLMRELSGLSHEEIAIVLGTSVGAAKQTIFEARRALLEFAEGRAMSCEEVRRMISDADRRVLRGRRVRAHLRDCAVCSAFAAAIPARTADLRALAPPLPAIAAGGLLARVIGRGGAHVGGAAHVGSGGGASAAGAAGIATGKTAILGLAAKAVAGVAIVSAGTVAVTNAVVHHSPSRSSVPPIAQHPWGGQGVSSSALALASAAQKGSGGTAAAPSPPAAAPSRPTAASSTGRSKAVPGSPARGNAPPGRSIAASQSTSAAMRGSATASAARSQRALGSGQVTSRLQRQQPKGSGNSAGAARGSSLSKTVRLPSGKRG